ncbi:MAG TPA: Na-translocating system protein MpsC family protein [Solirubrobacteraceae bacterium]|jgi:uncharacterized protein YbcI|nr:Na-translocating system protein MpsC family protein [Solirubrobacteraceae bacterium]
MSGYQADRPSGEVTASISKAVVRLLSDYTGRGPTKARTHLSKDLVTVVLHDSLTKGERSLVREGDVSIVLDTRKAFQRAMKEDLVAAVEHHSGRTVTAFLSANHIEPDIAVETFLLEPETGGDIDSPVADAMD